MKTFPRLWLIAAGMSASLQAQVVITTSTQRPEDGSTYAVSNSDLLQTSLSSVSADRAPNWAGQQLSTLTNGQFGGASYLANYVAEAVGFNSPTTLTYNLDIGAMPGGYTITRIATFASWDTNLDSQQYTVSYSTVSAPSTFVTLANVPLFDPPTPPFSVYSQTRVELTSLSGTLATNVACIQFTFLQAEVTLYREIDVVGAVPEPASYATFAGLAVLGLVARRPRRTGSAK